MSADLTDDDRDALYRIRRAGTSGVPLGEITASASIRLELFGLVEITADADGWQSARITRTGASAAQQRRFG